VSGGGPVGVEFEFASAGVCGEFRGSIEEPVAQGGGFGAGEFPLDGEELEPAGEVDGQGKEGAPGLVDREALGGHQVQREGLAPADAGLDMECRGRAHGVRPLH
jgi:hypothetical protein